MYQSHRKLCNPSSGRTRNKYKNSAARVRCRDTSSRNMLSSSSSSEDEEDNLLGISHETISGIKLCEIDSLENFLSTERIAYGVDSDALSENDQRFSFQQNDQGITLPSSASHRSSHYLSASQKQFSCANVPASSLPNVLLQATASVSGLLGIPEPQFPTASPTESQTGLDEPTDLDQNQEESMPLKSQASKSYTILPTVVQTKDLAAPKQPCSQVFQNEAPLPPEALSANPPVHDSNVPQPELRKSVLRMSAVLSEHTRLLSSALGEDSKTVHSSHSCVSKLSRIPVGISHRGVLESGVKAQLLELDTQVGPSDELGQVLMTDQPPGAKHPENQELSNPDSDNVVNQTSGHTAYLYEGELSAFNSDFDEECDAKYCNQANNSLSPDSVPEETTENLPNPIQTKDVQHTLPETYQETTGLGDNEIARALDPVKEEDSQEYFESTDICDKDHWYNEALKVCCMPESNNLNQPTASRAKLRKEPAGTSSEENFVDALESIESYTVLAKRSQGLAGKSRTAIPCAENDTKEPSKSHDKIVETCKRTFHKMFPMHVNENGEDSAQSDAPVRDENDNLILPPDKETANSDKLQRKPSDSSKFATKMAGKASGTTVKAPSSQSPPVTARNHGADDTDLVDDKAFQNAKVKTRWSNYPEFVDTLYVEIKLDCGRRYEKENVPESVVLTFPLHKDDKYSPLVIVQNCHLLNPKIQYVNTPSEVVYYLPSEMRFGGRRVIGTFLIRSTLAIPVSFKLTSVQHLELVPSFGVILPRQSVTIQMEFVFQPNFTNLNRLKLEGVLVYAAPFVFNRGCNERNIENDDVLEFWSKFPGPRFQYAQTRFVAVKVLRTSPSQKVPKSYIRTWWNTIRDLKLLKYEPQTLKFPDYASDVLESAKVSPVGHMILRRRQTLLVDVQEHAEDLNDTRTLIALSAFFFASGYTLYYFYSSRIDARKAEMLKRAADITWLNNLYNWVYKMVTTPVIKN